MRISYICALALAAAAPATQAHAQAAAPPNVVVAPRLLTPDTPRFQRLGGEQAFCVKDTRKKARRRAAGTNPDHEPCKAE